MHAELVDPFGEPDEQEPVEREQQRQHEQQQPDEHESGSAGLQGKRNTSADRKPAAEAKPCKDRVLLGAQTPEQSRSDALPVTRLGYDRPDNELPPDGFEALLWSARKAQRGVLWKGTVAHYSLHALEQTFKLANELERGAYRPKPPVEFTIYRPKKREILAVCFRDRVYQRAINDLVLYPTMTRSFIPENGACQTGKGTDYCLNLFRKQLRRQYINHGPGGYILQMDIRHYYPSMRHDAVKAAFARKLDPWTMDTVAAILDWQYPGEVGYNPGSQMVQIAGISLLDGIDHMIKQKLHIRNYIRVMDDMVLIHEDREYLRHCRDVIAGELAALGFTPHPDKTRIVSMKQGVAFLGFDWRVTDTGRVLQQPKPQAVKEYRRIMRKLMKLYARGERSRESLDDSNRTRLEFMAKGTNKQLIKRLDKWYREEMRKHEIQRHLLAAHTVPA